MPVERVHAWIMLGDQGLASALHTREKVATTDCTTESVLMTVRGLDSLEQTNEG